MTHMTEEEFQIINQRRNPSPNNFNRGEADEDVESTLQSKIKAHCKAKGWPILSFPSTPAVRNYLPPGWPDISIKLPFGQTLDIETKSGSGRLSDKQKLMKAMFAYLGHVVHQINSYKGYLQLVEKVMRRE